MVIHLDKYLIIVYIVIIKARKKDTEIIKSKTNKCIGIESNYFAVYIF